MTRSTNHHQEATMFVLRTRNPDPARQGELVPLALVRHAHIDPESGGVWCWMGHFQDATMEELTPGTILKDWIMWTDEDNTRRDWTCLKVNRVTAKFTDGQTTRLVRIDR